MKTCIFIGPSGRGVPHPEGVDIFSPARLGSVHQAVLAGYERIALVDAYFGNVPSVWHKELLYAIAKGREVWGSSSTGAIRAAELDTYGMHGIGAAYRLFRRGALTDEDEPCLLHGDRSTGYIQLTYPMLNVRCTLRKMRRSHLIEAVAERDIAAALKKIHFTQRNPEVVRLVFQDYESCSPGRLWSYFLSCYTDVKRRDACALFHALGSPRERAVRSRRQWEFPQTSFWVQQFIAHHEEFPPLDGDCASTGTNTWQI